MSVRLTLPGISTTSRQRWRASASPEDAGFLLQIDDPDLPDGWNCLPDITLPEYRKYAATRVGALNHALKGIPREKIRLHVGWGNHHGPHHDDIPLRDIIDLIFRVNAGSSSIEASNPCHEHEWKVFEEVKLPDGATLIRGVVGHCSDFIEHPDLVAERTSPDQNKARLAVPCWSGPHQRLLNGHPPSAHGRAAPKDRPHAGYSDGC